MISMTFEPPAPPLTETAVDADRYTPPAAVRWGLREAAVGLLLFVAVIVGAGVLVATGVVEGSDLAQFVLSLLGYGVLAGVAVYASHRLGAGSLAKDFWLRLRPVDLAIGLGVGLLAKILSVVWGVIAIALFGLPEQQSNLVLSTDTVWLVINGVIVVAVVAPIVEELYLRGLVMQAVRNAVLRSGGRSQPAAESVQRAAVLVSIAVSALVFMGLHLYQSTDAALLTTLALGTLTLGVVNAMIVYLTGRLGAAIVAHMVFNGISVATLLLVGGA